MFRYTRLTTWPHATPKHLGSPYTAGLDAILDQLLREMRSRNAKEPELQMFLPERYITGKGLPSLTAPDRPKECRDMHPGVVVLFTVGEARLQFPASKYRTWRENLRAIGETLEQLRRIERDGVGYGDEQYQGYALKPVNQGVLVASAPKSTEQIHTAAQMIGRWAGAPYNTDWQSLVTSPSVLELSYRLARKAAHPDIIGDSTAFLSLQRAKETLDHYHGGSK